VGENDSFSLSGRTTGGHHERIPGLDRKRTGSRASAFHRFNNGRAELVEKGLFCMTRQTLIDGQYGVAMVPGSLQGLDELRTASHVDCHQFGHDS
jgi:hypothetical protein